MYSFNGVAALNDSYIIEDALLMIWNRKGVGLAMGNGQLFNAM